MVTDDNVKRRLVTHDEIALAIGFFLSHGISEDALAEELINHFFIDMDVFNDVLVAMLRSVAENGPNWRQVA